MKLLNEGDVVRIKSKENMQELLGTAVIDTKNHGMVYLGQQDIDRRLEYAGQLVTVSHVFPKDSWSRYDSYAFKEHESWLNRATSWQPCFYLCYLELEEQRVCTNKNCRHLLTSKGVCPNPDCEGVRGKV